MNSERLFITLDAIFTRTEAENIKKRLQGKTYFNFDIQIANCGGNYYITVESRINEGRTEADWHNVEDLKGMFFYVALHELAEDTKKYHGEI